MSEEVFSLIKAGSSFDELESYLTSLPIDHENLHLILNRRNVDRYTPFHCAIFARNMDACRVLLKYGADINLKNTNQKTAYDLSKNDNIKELLSK